MLIGRLGFFQANCLHPHPLLPSATIDIITESPVRSGWSKKGSYIISHNKESEVWFIQRLKCDIKEEVLSCFLDWPRYGPRWLPLPWVSHADNNVQKQKKWCFLLSVFFFSRVPQEIALLVSVDRTVYMSISKPITDQRNFISMLSLDQSLFTCWGWGKSSLIQSLDPWLLNQESILGIRKRMSFGVALKSSVFALLMCRRPIPGY